MVFFGYMYGYLCLNFLYSFLKYLIYLYINDLHIIAYKIFVYFDFNTNN